MFGKRFLVFLLVVFLGSVSVPADLYAQKSAGEILDHTNETLKPNSVQEKEEEEHNNAVGWICELFGNPLICSGYQTHTIYSPNAKIPQDMTEQDIENAIALLDELETGDIAGTQSARVLAGNENIFARLLSLTGLFTDKETASTTRHTWPSGISDSLGADPEGAVADKMARGMLMPAALQLGTFNATPIPIPGSSTEIPPNGPHYGLCEMGSGACSVQNLLPYFGNDELAAQQASIICQKESSSNPQNVNKGCYTGEFLDHSIGLFQINLLDHCSSSLLSDFSDSGYTGPAFDATDVFVYNGSSPAFPCQVKDVSKLTQCEAAMLDPENNIAYAAHYSGNGSSWTAWSAAQACEIVGGQPLEPQATPIPTPPAGGYTVYYQNDPTYASFALPGGCTYIQAACGPFTAVNALVNNGIAMSPQQLINGYYTNAGCDGTGIEQGRQILSRSGLGVPSGTATYLFTGSYLGTSAVINEFQNQTDAGWMIWAVADFCQNGNCIGHHFLVVGVSGGSIYTLDPYYGYDNFATPPAPRAVPFNQDLIGKEVYYKAAFKFRKI